MILCFIADGRSIHTQRWIEYFAQNGHEVHLITYDPMNRGINGVIEHVIVSRWKNLYLSFFPRHLAIKKLVKKIRPDLIHAHFITKYGFHILGIGVFPKIVSAWGDDILVLPKKSWVIYQYTRKVLMATDLIFSDSQDISNHIISDFSITSDKVRYLPFGTDTELFSPGNKHIPENRTTIEIFSNRGFFPVYDQKTLVEGFALAYQKDRRFRLTLKGEGPDEQKIRDLIASLGISEVVTFKKKTDYSEVPNDYRNADIFVSTSISDGIPVSIQEAMASGLPCIVTAVGGIPELIENEKNGFLISRSSSQQLAEGLLKLARDPSLLSQLGTAARETIIEHFQWNTLMTQAEKDYQALIKTYKQDRP
jgi:glycosyltransferase involved in cell wall biosynthesis